jgi:glycosyltransferase involved in cell wall biosynthesis
LNAPLILFVSINATSDQRKGYHLLEEALTYVSQRQKKLNAHLAVVGTNEVDSDLSASIPTMALGYVEDEAALARIYSMADVFVAPSIQDNLPNTVLEALASGTPTVAFNIGGFPDLIDHKRDGYLAEPFDTEDLAQGIIWILERRRHRRLRIAARKKATSMFSLARQARAYRDLYRERITGDSQMH